MSTYLVHILLVIEGRNPKDKKIFFAFTLALHLHLYYLIYNCYNITVTWVL